ncbi:glycosyltransferase family 4 protein [Bacillus tianshenii]|nr:glycosyltransferase family 4 protein [Bacillus tianshenii]
MKKVCILSSVHPLHDMRIFHKEAKSLANAGYSVSYIVQHDRSEDIDGIQIHALNKPKNRIERINKVKKELYEKALQEDAEIYHFHDPELIPVGLKLKKHGKKVIYDVHEDVPRQILTKHWIPKPLRTTISKTFEQYENRAALRFDRVAAATPFIEERFRKLGCNSVNINNYPILDEWLSTEMDWAKKEQAVCYVGGISKVRGAFENIQAVAGKDMKLLLAGRFADQNEQIQAEQMDGWGNTEFLGYLDREGIAETFKRSMAGLVTLHPTKNYVDALPVKMFEYMAAGLPVIASNFKILEEIVEHHQCGICVNPLSTKEIADAAEWIVNHPNEAQAMGENGRKAVLETFNWKQESSKLLALYEKL